MGPELSRMVCTENTDLITVVESVGVDDISQREQGKNQGLNTGIDQLLRRQWEKTEGVAGEEAKVQQGHRNQRSLVSRRKEWRTVK